MHPLGLEKNTADAYVRRPAVFTVCTGDGRPPELPPRGRRVLGRSRARLDEGAAALWRQHAADVHGLVLRDSAPALPTGRRRPRRRARRHALSEAAAVRARRDAAAPPEARPPPSALKRVVIEEDDELDYRN